MKTETPRISVGHGNLLDSRYPYCDELQPQLEKQGKGWILELARWYESDWALAVDGGPTPSVDLVVQLIDPARQEEIRTVLESIDTRYSTARKQRLSGQIDATIDSAARMHVKSDNQSDPALEATMDSRPPDVAHSKYEELDVTIDGASDATEPDPTMDGSAELPGSADMLATIDSAQRPKAQKTSPNVEDNRKPKPIPGYRIKRILGRGGMGVVYLAQQEGIDRLVALKMILGGGHADQVMLDRFQAEARAIGRFQHENIVRIFDYGTHDGMPYFSLEFIEGNSLSGFLDGKPIEPMEAAKLLEPMARAMQYAHDAGVIHRDLKPANVLITSDGVPKITDFGLAKEFETDGNLSVSGAIVGTPAYMAPEQARAESDVGPLADIYGLGAVLYCMMTGRPPFQGAKATDTLLQVIRSEPVEPIKLQPGIPKDLETICMKCLEKEKSQRYQDGAELADDLGRFIRGEPITARPISPPERVWRWCKRNPKMAIASGLAASLALIVMIGGPTSAAVIWQQKKNVVAAKNEAVKNEEIAVANERKAVAAKEQANKNAEAASVQEKNAIDALKSLTFVVQKKMAGRRDLRQLREDLLTTVRNGLMRMARFENTARDQNMIAAGIHVRLGDIHMEIGQADKAHEEYAKCLAIFEKLKKEDALPYAESNESKIYQLLGDAARKNGELDKANEYHQKSLQIRRDWVNKTPNAKSSTNLAVSLGKLGSLAQVRGDLAGARKYMDEAVAVRQDLQNQNPNQPSAFNELMGAKLVLGKVQFQQGEVDEGTTLVEEVTRKMREHAERNPQSDGAQQNAAMFDAELGVMQLYKEDFDGAKENFKRAVDTFEDLKKKMPSDIRIHEELEEATYGLGVTHDEMGEQDLSKQMMDRLLELRRQTVELDENNIAYQLRLLIALARSGDVTEAVELAGKLDEAIPEQDTIRYDLACGYALLARARGEITEGEDSESLPSQQELRESAVECLQQAIEAGFARPTDLKLDPDLAPIREMPEFPQTAGRELDSRRWARGYSRPA